MITGLLISFPNNESILFSVGEDEVEEIKTTSGTSGTEYIVIFKDKIYKKFRNLGFTEVGTLNE